jgi:hypothetical protein
MSIRLDPRRVNALKQLAGDAGMRPGDLVRTWVEERIDLEWRGQTSGGTGAGGGLAARIDELAARVAALESLSNGAASAAPTAPEQPAEAVAAEPVDEGATAPKRRGRPRTRTSAAPSQPRVPLHEEMIAVITERGPQTAGQIAAAIVERGRYSPPRSGKPLDAAMVSQRVSNPTYRSRFTRRDGRIGLASAEPGDAAEPADAPEATEPAEA